MELLRCYYNFVRPHGALKFGREIRTPAMQAGLTTRWLTFRDIFLATTIPLWSRIEVFLLTGARNLVSSAPVPVPSIYSSASRRVQKYKRTQDRLAGTFRNKRVYAWLANGS